ncbi:MAG: EamA family transporter [Caldilineaceae bacterium]|nr:EamA family transporter [Caldilineaceae bacterium]
MLPSVFFGILSALTWGAGDFFGGLATKRAHPFTVVHVAEWVGAVVLVALALLFGEALPSGTTLLWAAGAGLLGAIGLLALYTGLASGHMGIVAALSAVVAALVPIIFGALTEGLPAPLQLLGFGVGLVAIWLLTSSHDRTVHPRELWLAVIAGLGFGFYFVLIDRTVHDGVFWNLAFARSVAGVVLLGILLATRRPLLPPRPVLPLNVANGVLDAGGNLFFALAAQSGRLDIAAVVASLYPGTTVLLARLVLKERLNRLQTVGAVAALAAVVLVAL